MKKMFIRTPAFKSFIRTSSTLLTKPPLKYPSLAVMPLRQYSDVEAQDPHRALSAVLMRSGTSKGLFIHRDQLPSIESEWAPILAAAMGSTYGDKRQLDGVGGATSTTSKVAVVSRSERPGIDVDYTFAQVAVGTAKVDMTGNCGNMAAGVGPFALTEGLVKAEPGQKQVSDAHSHLFHT